MSHRTKLNQYKSDTSQEVSGNDYLKSFFFYFVMDQVGNSWINNYYNWIASSLVVVNEQYR